MVSNINNIGPSFISCLRTDRPDGLYATVVCDECGVALGLVYSSQESICESIQTGRGVYYSRIIVMQVLQSIKDRHIQRV